MTDFTAYEVSRSGTWVHKIEECILTYDERFLRRKVLNTCSGKKVLIDLPQTTSLENGDALKVEGGNFIKITSAVEPLLEITGKNLVLLAWHIGNRHTPCQIDKTRLLIQDDPVIGHMLEHLGANVKSILEPFNPEKGAYGFGRTHSHDHGHTSHD